MSFDFTLVDRLSAPARGMLGPLDAVTARLKATEAALARVNRAQKQLQLDRLTGAQPRNALGQFVGFGQAGRGIAADRLRLQLQRDALRGQIGDAPQVGLGRALMQALSPARALRHEVDAFGKGLRKAAKDGALLRGAIHGVAEAAKYMAAGLTAALAAAGYGLLQLARHGLETQAAFAGMRRDFERSMGAAKGGAGFEDVQRLARTMGVDTIALATNIRNLRNAGFGLANSFEIVQRLLDLGGNEESTQLTLKAITDIAAKGRLAGQELNQLAEHGIERNQIIAAIYNARLARGVRTTMAGVRDEVSNGRVSAEEGIAAIDSAIAAMTGGQRAGAAALERAMATPLGQWNRFKVTVEQFFGNLDATGLAPLTRLLGKLNQLFDPATESGRRFQRLLNDLFTRLFGDIDSLDLNDVFAQAMSTVERIIKLVPGIASGIMDGVSAVSSLVAAFEPLINFLADWKATFGASRTMNEGQRGVGAGGHVLTTFEERQAGRVQSSAVGEFFTGSWSSFWAALNAEVSSEGVTMGRGLTAGLRQGMEIHSPSRATIEMGEQLIAGLNEGLLRPREAPPLDLGSGETHNEIHVHIDGAAHDGDPEGLAAAIREQLAQLLTSYAAARGRPA